MIKRHPLSEETKNKISLAHIGMKHSKKSIEKMRQIHKAIQTPELREKNRLAQPPLRLGHE